MKPWQLFENKRKLRNYGLTGYRFYILPFKSNYYPKCFFCDCWCKPGENSWQFWEARQHSKVVVIWIRKLKLYLYSQLIVPVQLQCRNNFEVILLKSFCFVLLFINMTFGFCTEPLKMKPWFVRKLPSRLEILEGQSFSLYCSSGRSGCKPWFVQKLPSTMEILRGEDLQMNCYFGNSTDHQLGTALKMDQKCSPQTQNGIWTPSTRYTLW